MSQGFVKDAAEIGEEILTKVASIPGDVKSFLARLNTKTASVQSEKLELPKRMSLAELQKIAHDNGHDLPKVASIDVDTADFSKVAADLRKVADRRDDDLAREVFEDAAAIVARRIEKQAAPRPQVRVAPAAAAAAPARAARPAPAARPNSGALGPMPVAKPGFFARHLTGEGRLQNSIRREHLEGHLARQRAKNPGRPEFATAQDAEAMKEHAARKGEFAEKALGTAPAIGLAVGAPLAAAAVLRGNKEKKEEVKIYK